MSNPFFSIIVPTHNGRDRLPGSLSSVLMQTYDNYELIVVCDACSDGSEKYVKENYDANVISVKFKRDGLARNAGLDAAKGEWILFLDDDDHFVHEYCLQRLAEKLMDEESDLDVLDFSFIWKGKGYKIPSADECFVMVWCRAWRRSFIGDSRFDDTPYGSDKNFFTRMIKNNPNVKIKFWDYLIYYYDYMREGSLSWGEKRKKLLDIVIVHHDEPWSIGKPFFDMLQMQRCVEMSNVAITLVQNGKDYALPFAELLKDYSFPVTIITTEEAYDSPAPARNLAIQQSEADWIMFCDFDDHFADVCSLSMIMRNFPTDEYDIIWMKMVHETRWYTGITYLNRIDSVVFSDSHGKMYRRQFLIDHRIDFPSLLPLHYDAIFNAVAVAECDPWRIANMTTDFYPYIKTYRYDGRYTTFNAHYGYFNTIPDRDAFLADMFKQRGNDVAYKRAVTKVILKAYFDLCEADTKDFPVTPSDDFISYYREHSDIFHEVLNSPDIDVIANEVETEILNFVQTCYNYHKREFYFINDSISLKDWVSNIDSTVFGEAQPAPVHEELPTVPVKPAPVPIIHKDERIVVYCGTYEVYLDMLESAKSLLCNTPVDHIIFLTEDDVFPYELPDIITTFNVKPYAMQLFDENGPNYYNAWTYMCMVRAAFPDIFKEYSRILSLDVDVVINEDISRLWNYDMTDYYLAGVAERQRQKSSSDPLYVNFGVVMMNLDKMREDNIQPQLIEMLNKQKLGCPEQDAFNRLCAWHILELPPEYNYTAYSHITGESQRQRIIHYAGQKFWRHFSNVKKYSEMDWTNVMLIQNGLKEGEQNAT